MPPGKPNSKQVVIGEISQRSFKMQQPRSARQMSEQKARA